MSQPSAAPPFLSVRGLKKRYDSRPVLAGLELALPRGEIYGLLGPNGAGKTTTLKILAGLLEPGEGEILLDGVRFRRTDRALRRRVAYVPDQPFLYGKLTGEEHLHFMLDLYERPRAGRGELFDSYFRQFEFEAYRDELVENFSAGTKQKLLIVQALAVAPDLLLLDEPLVSIDPIVSRKFKLLLQERAAAGMVILFATHILPMAQQICSHIGVLEGGIIRAEGTAAELSARAGGGSLEDFYFALVSGQ
ncbi:MAG TPA: ABC transporter ATP-binding protein [Candidatus Aminicenantes bacterium]|nr:ABC transporter ATP-binding protein [Candidatus Aminicenantes bacterium]